MLKFSVIVHYNTRSLTPRQMQSASGNQMNNRIDQITKGLISLTVMLMFTVAFIAGQARANLPADELLVDDRAQVAETGVILDTEYLRMLETLPHLVDMFLELPIDIEIPFDELSLRHDDASEAGSDDSRVR